jgi:hypothetical protein
MIVTIDEQLIVKSIVDALDRNHRITTSMNMKYIVVFIRECKKEIFFRTQANKFIGYAMCTR